MTKTTDVDAAQDEGQCDRYLSALERLPHLSKSVTLMWGSPELDKYIATLMMDSRDGVRQGLPLDVAAELQFLAETNKTVRAIDLMKKTKINLNAAYRLIDDADRATANADPWAGSAISKDVSASGRAASAPAVRPARQTAKPPPARGWLGRLFR